MKNGHRGSAYIRISFDMLKKAFDLPEDTEIVLAGQDELDMPNSFSIFVVHPDIKSHGGRCMMGKDKEYINPVFRDETKLGIKFVQWDWDEED